MEYLKQLAARADLAAWNSWGMQYRVLVVVVGLMAAYLALKAVLPAVLHLARWVLFFAFVLFGVWVLFPAEVCSIDLVAKLPLLCVR